MHPKHKHHVRSRSRSRSRERHPEPPRARQRSRSRSNSPIRPKEERDHKHRHRVHHNRPSEHEDERPRGGAARKKLNHRERHRQQNRHVPVRIKQEPSSPPSNANTAPPAPKEKPNFQVSGKLAEDTNIYNGVVVKYNEPPEARKPKRRWRLYPFKGDDSLPMLPIHRQSAYLLGRERRVADIPIDHPSCSKQHAAFQYRLVKYERDDGTIGQRVRPYIIDLESANGTFVNNQKIDPRRYVELMEKDVIKFGFSSREYVILHEESKDEIHDDDVVEEGSPNLPEADANEAATTSRAREAA